MYEASYYDIHMHTHYIYLINMFTFAVVQYLNYRNISNDYRRGCLPHTGIMLDLKTCDRLYIDNLCSAKLEVIYSYHVQCMPSSVHKMRSWQVGDENYYLLKWTCQQIIC